MTEPECPHHPQTTTIAGAAPGGAEDALIARWLSPDPERGGLAAWRVTERGPEVWALAGFLEEAAEAVPEHRRPILELAAADFHLPAEALLAALAFYLRHRAAIDAVAEANRPELVAPGTPPGQATKATA